MIADNMLPTDWKATLQRCDAVLFGAVGDPARLRNKIYPVYIVPSFAQAILCIFFLHFRFYFTANPTTSTTNTTTTTTITTTSTTTTSNTTTSCCYSNNNLANKKLF